jgi:hypothetical protein
MFNVLTQAPGEAPYLGTYASTKLANALTYAKRSCRTGNFAKVFVVGDGGYTKTLTCELNARAMRAQAALRGTRSKRRRRR